MIIVEFPNASKNIAVQGLGVLPRHVPRAPCFQWRQGFCRAPLPGKRKPLHGENVFVDKALII